MSKFNPFDDIDPVETTEWLESIDSVLAQHGPERAHLPDDRFRPALGCLSPIQPQYGLLKYYLEGTTA